MQVVHCIWYLWYYCQNSIIERLTYETSSINSIGKWHRRIKTQRSVLKRNEILQPTNSAIKVEDSTGQNREVLNFCANNYLGLADNPELIKEKDKKPLEKYGFGMASVRFICGTQTIHKTLEQKISQFLGTEDTI